MSPLNLGAEVRDTGNQRFKAQERFDALLPLARNVGGLGWQEQPLVEG